jgi:flagellar basal body-associated protein FliL
MACVGQRKVCAMNTFEVRTFKDGRWTTDTRCNSNEEALAIANTLAGDRHIDGVKVVEETYDESDGLFREKTVFSYFKQDDKVFNPRLNKSKDEDVGGAASAGARVLAARAAARGGADKGGIDMRAWMLILGLLVSLGGNVALAIYWGSGELETTTADRRISGGGDGSGLVVYDLPPVTTNYKDASGTKVVKMRLGLELSSRDNVREVQERLSKIINRVASDLSDVEGADLNNAQGLNKLRESLHEGVKKAAGEDAPIEGVLFKEVLVF